jgi:hypothetical protein
MRATLPPRPLSVTSIAGIENLRVGTGYYKARMHTQSADTLSLDT